jgi:Na+-transporting methylmalonyl-CoA/oxaloacetate decarboxylase gamma subunit
MNNDLINGLIIMGVGMAGVFLVLVLFYIIILLLKKFFPYKPESDD